MKKDAILFSLAVHLLTVHNIRAQVATDITELTPPSNPALTLMGLQPMEVSKPKNLDQLEVTVVNSFTQANQFIIPNDFALEFMPYWLRSNPHLIYDAKDFQNPKCRPLQNLGISLATVNDSAGKSLANNSKVGFGLRTQLLSGKISNDEIDRLNEIKLEFKIENEIYGDLKAAIGILKSKLESNILSLVSIDATITALFAEIPQSYSSLRKATLREKIVNFIEINYDSGSMQNPANKSEIVEFLNNLSTETDSWMEFSKKVDEIEKIITNNKYGLFIEIAGSLYLNFPTGDFNYSRIPKLGTWTLITYKTENQVLDFSGMLRFIRDFELEKGTSNYDFGSAIYFNQPRFSISAEYLYRLQNTTIERTLLVDGFSLVKRKIRDDFRASINATYKFSDQINLCYSLSKSFKFDSINPNQIISQLSLNIGLGQVPLSISNKE